MFRCARRTTPKLIFNARFFSSDLSDSLEDDYQPTAFTERVTRSENNSPDRVVIEIDGSARNEKQTIDKDSSASNNTCKTG